MEDLVKIDDSLFIIDMKYATKDNFMNKVLYKDLDCMIRSGTYKKLMNVALELKKYNLKLKIWDAYRPFSIQLMMWNEIHDERYVSNPYVNTYHPRGSSLDVTLCDMNGVELEMPTKFDDFSEKASRNYFDSLNEKVKNNVLLLENIMKNNGFIPLQSEWWHFTDVNIYDVIR